MDGRGRYLDNIFIERLWRSVKQEKIYRYDFETIEEAVFVNKVVASTLNNSTSAAYCRAALACSVFY